jgi:naphthoate synthase
MNYESILVKKEGKVSTITLNRPQSMNFLDPAMAQEIEHALMDAEKDEGVRAIVITGAGRAFSAGGDVRFMKEDHTAYEFYQRMEYITRFIWTMISLPKPIIAMVAGYAVGGGHVLHLVCDLTIAADNAVFGQTGPRVGSFDGGYGAGLLARMVGDKRAREIWYLCRQYSAQDACQMGMVNKVVPLAELETETVAWAREILAKSPLAVRLMKAALNAAADGLAGQQQLAGDATLLFYMSEEAQEGRDSFVEKRDPDFGRFPRLP